MKGHTCWALLSAISLSGYAQVGPGIQWQNTIGGSGLDNFSSIQQTTDGGYILAGSSESPISGDKSENSFGSYDYWVVKIDGSGNIQWQRTIGGSGLDLLRSVRQTTDGGYILGGSSGSGISGNKTEASNGAEDYWIVKVDGAGNVLWQNSIGGSGTDELQAIEQTADGGFVLGGYSTSPISGDKTENSDVFGDYWIVKTDPSGNIQWQNSIGGSGIDELTCIQQVTDGGYIIGGVSSSPLSGDKTEDNLGLTDHWIVKTDAAGNIQWQNTIGGGGDDRLKSIQQTTDGGYMLGGTSTSFISGDKTETCNGVQDYWIVKIDAGGNIQWQNTIGGDNLDILGSVRQTTDGGYIIGGASLSTISGDKAENNAGAQDHWIVKVDAVGNIEWQSTIGGSGAEDQATIEQTADGGYVLGGSSDSPISGDKSEGSNGTNDLWIVKLAPDGATAIDQLPVNGLSVSLVPNPATSHLAITSKDAAIGNAIVLNTLGEHVRVDQAVINERSRALDVRTLASGLYTVLVTAGDRSASATFVKE